LFWKPEWWNWQTRTLEVRMGDRAGSSPASGTIFSNNEERKDREKVRENGSFPGWPKDTLVQLPVSVLAQPVVSLLNHSIVPTRESFNKKNREILLFAVFFISTEVSPPKTAFIIV
jgi:hypothetical protein